MANGKTSNVGDIDISAVINAQMDSGTEETGRQNKMIKYMFLAEVTYSLDWIMTYHAAVGVAKTELIDDRLSLMCDNYKKTRELHDKTKVSKEGSAEERLGITDACLAKMVPAREMLKRSIVSLHYLRHNGVKELVIRDDGRLALTVKNKNGENETTNFTGRELTRVGTALKPKSTRAPRAPVGEAIEKATVQTLTQTVNGMERILKAELDHGLPEGVEFNKEHTEKLDQILTQLLIRRFGDAGKIDKSGMVKMQEFIAKINAPPMSAKQSEERQDGLDKINAAKNGAKKETAKV